MKTGVCGYLAHGKSVVCEITEANARDSISCVRLQWIDNAKVAGGISLTVA